MKSYGPHSPQKGLWEVSWVPGRDRRDSVGSLSGSPIGAGPLVGLGAPELHEAAQSSEKEFDSRRK